jgi:DNA-binding LacI/PurR family transcriptional regulator
MAQGLRSKRTHMLTVLVPLFTRYFYVEVLRGIEMGLDASDYGLLIRSIEKESDRERAFAVSGMRNRADGVLIVSLMPSADLVGRLRAAHCPLVLVDAEYPGLPSVTVDHEAASIVAVGHLLDVGHTRIGLIDRAEDPFTSGYTGGRRAGYRKALRDAKLPLRPEYEIVTDFVPEAGMAALDTLLALPEPPTAVFVGSDSQALGVLEGARRRGCRVPQDLSVVGYNDIEVSQYLGLTTMRVPMCEMGRRGIDLLFAALADPQQPAAQERLFAELVVRATTAPPGTDEGRPTTDDRRKRET